MAQTQAPAQTPTQTEAAPEPKKSSGRKKLIWIGICIMSMVSGAVAPMAFGAHKLLGSTPSEKKAAEPATIPFGDVAVNLNDGRMTRYLRVKVVIQTDATEVKDLTKHVEKHKPALKNWLIGHLSGKGLKDVGGTVGVKRIQREIQERFEEMLFPEGEGKPFEVLFEEFVVQ